jgi:hypothetical protein
VSSNSRYGPTGPPDELFGVRFVGDARPCSAAECAKPVWDASPGRLVLVDLILARSALGEAAPHSCVTRRIDLHAHPALLRATGTVLGVARRSFVTGSLFVGTAELRTPSGMVLGTATGRFVASDALLPVAYESEPRNIEVGSLGDLLKLRFDADPHTGTLPTGPRTRIRPASSTEESRPPR